MTEAVGDLERRIDRLERLIAGLTPAEHRLVSGRFDTIAAIVKDAVQIAGVPARDLLADSRRIELAEARFAVAWVARRTTAHSSTQLGRALNRDHTTILAQVRRADVMRRSDPDFRALSDELLRRAEARAGR